jgi:uncharacterized protein YutE (UPF0331/DUF86 family)
MDKERIISLIDRLNLYFDELENYLPKDFNEYSENLEKKRFCERTIQLLIEVCIDISSLLVKELRLGIPEEEENVFDKLFEKKIISKQIMVQLKDMKRFRNVLVHHYAKIDDHLVFQHISKNRKDFIDFKGEIIEFLKNS